MHNAQVSAQLKEIVRNCNHLNELASSPETPAGVLNMLNLRIGVATGQLSRGFLDFRELTILEAEMLEAAKSLPSDAAKTILTLAIHTTAYVIFQGRRVQADGSIMIPSEDSERDRPVDRLRALALTLDPDTLMPKGNFRSSD